MWTVVYSKQVAKDSKKYEVFEKEHIVRILRMWTHYE